MSIHSAWTPFRRSLSVALPFLLLAGLTVPALAVAAWAGGAAGGFLALLVAGQFALLFGLLHWYYRRRLADRLERLASEADAMVDGRFDVATDVHGGDDIGRLAASLDRLRRVVGARIADDAARFDAAPVGLVLVRNRVIERANRRAETLLGAPPNGLAGTSAEAIYRSRDEFIDVGARAYAAMEAGGVFCEEIVLARRDGSGLAARFSGCAIDPARPQDGSIWAISPGGAR